jgi:hypothetical protein
MGGPNSPPFSSPIEPNGLMPSPRGLQTLGVRYPDVWQVNEPGERDDGCLREAAVIPATSAGLVRQPRNSQVGRARRDLPNDHGAFAA